MPRKSGWENGEKCFVLWHVSSEKLGKLMPRSKFFGLSGLFLSQSYASLIEDWCPFVFGKKHRDHPYHEYRKTAYERWDVLRSKDVRSKEELEEMWRLRESLDRFAEVGGGYSSVYVHKLVCPEAVYVKAMKLYNQKFDEHYKESQFGFWAWGEQVFIPAEDLSKVRVDKVVRMNKGEFTEEYSKLYRSKQYRNFHFYKQEAARWAKENPDAKS